MFNGEIERFAAQGSGHGTVPFPAGLMVVLGDSPCNRFRFSADLGDQHAADKALPMGDLTVDETTLVNHGDLLTIHSQQQPIYKHH